MLRIALADAVAESARLLSATLPARLTLDVKYGADLPAVIADTTQIQQVVINLFTNAMQAMPADPGHIGIHLDVVTLDAQLAGHHPANAALAALAADPASFDLLVTDFNMPGMSGLDVARQARLIRADLPVAIVSGFIDEALHNEAAGAGVRELIFKADVAEDFCEAVARLVKVNWILVLAATGYGTLCAMPLWQSMQDNFSVTARWCSVRAKGFCLAGFIAWKSWQ